MLPYYVLVNLLSTGVPRSLTRTGRDTRYQGSDPFESGVWPVASMYFSPKPEPRPISCLTAEREARVSRPCRIPESKIVKKLLRAKQPPRLHPGLQPWRETVWHVPRVRNPPNLARAATGCTNHSVQRSDINSIRALRRTHCHSKYVRRVTAIG